MRLRVKCEGVNRRTSIWARSLGLEHGLVPAPGCGALWCLCAVLRKGWSDGERKILYKKQPDQAR